MKYVLLLVFTLSFQSAFGKEAGNGGDIIYCDNGKGKVELLDYYEGKLMRGISPSTLSPELSVKQNFRILLDNLSIPSPLRAARYEKWFTEFERDALMLRNVALVDIPDSHHLALENGCEIKQIIIQVLPRYPQDKRYTIDADLWDKLPNDSRAGLILHELIFRELIQFKSDTSDKKPLDSRDTRYLNSIIASGEVRSMTSLSFNQLLFSFDDFKLMEYPDLDHFLIIEKYWWPSEQIIYSENGKYLTSFHPQGHKFYTSTDDRKTITFGPFTFERDELWGKYKLKIDYAEGIYEYAHQEVYKRYSFSYRNDKCHVKEGKYDFHKLQLRPGVWLKAKVYPASLTSPVRGYGLEINAVELVEQDDPHGCLKILSHHALEMVYDLKKKRLVSVEGSHAFRSCGKDYKGKVFFDDEGRPSKQQVHVEYN
ncbi:MAG TPA: hypothetical protein VNJ01_07820 [Bacteriovoracaceae bacterium]|nr:hypothetical protein [Bacteriovoracaceae bacterium]